MSRSVQKVSTLVLGTLEVYDFSNDPVLGLVDADFTKFVTFNGANSVTVVTVTEIANGRYSYSYTPTAIGYWQVLIRQSTGAGYNKRGWTEDFDVTVDGEYSLSQIVNNVMDSVDSLIEIGYTFRQTMRLVSAAACGKVSGGPGLPVFRNMPDTANRISAVANPSGDRTSVTLTP